MLTYQQAFNDGISEHWGRRPTLWYSFWGSLALTSLLLFCISSVVIYVELVVLINMYAIAIATVWLYTPECYPTYIRQVTQNIMLLM